MHLAFFDAELVILFKGMMISHNRIIRGNCCEMGNNVKM